MTVIIKTDRSITDFHCLHDAYHCFLRCSLLFETLEERFEVLALVLQEVDFFLAFALIDCPAFSLSTFDGLAFILQFNHPCLKGALLLLEFSDGVLSFSL